MSSKTSSVLSGAHFVASLPEVPHLLTPHRYRSNDLTANARGCMADILCQLLEEAQTVPQDAVDELLRRLLPKNAVRTSGQLPRTNS